MRIDYSPPKQSYVTSQSKPRPRKEPVGLFTSLIAIHNLNGNTSSKNSRISKGGSSNGSLISSLIDVIRSSIIGSLSTS